MKINVKQYLEVELSDDEAFRIMKEQLFKLGGWNDNMYIKLRTTNNHVVMEVREYATSHSWNEHIELRKATPLDLAINTIVLLNRL